MTDHIDEPSEVVHIAGPVIQIGQYVRQRCSWCGATLVDHDLTRIAYPVGQDSTPPTWEPGGLVAIDGPVSWSIDHEDGAQLPAGACGRLDPAVTS